VTTVLLGANRFTGFTTILGWRGRPVLRIEEDAAVYLWSPDELLPTAIRVRVTSDAVQEADSPVLIVRASDKTSCGLFLKSSDHALVLATALGSSRVHVRLDLRPLGLVVYDDLDGLHIGGTRIAAQNIEGTGTAIWLG
jgi:hypothetical protein